MLKTLQKRIDKLQFKHGAKSLRAIYGAGCVKNPRAMFVFMNPTGRNVSAYATWRGLRAPWLGTKNIWKLFYELGFLSQGNLAQIQKFKPSDWSSEFADNIYSEIAKRGVYITNLAKCTQVDARPLSNGVFRDYLDILFDEINFIKPRHIVTFGNQVSSIILGKNVSVSSYKKRDGEIVEIGQKTFSVFPTHYPVGQGMRNVPLAIERIKRII